MYTPTTKIYTLSLHDALPILGRDREKLRINKVVQLQELTEGFTLTLKRDSARRVVADESKPAGRARAECGVRSSRALRHGNASPVHCGTVVFVSQLSHSPASVALAHPPELLRAWFPRPPIAQRPENQRACLQKRKKAKCAGS